MKFGSVSVLARFGQLLELHLCGAQAEKFQFPNEMLANKPNPNLVLECLLKTTF
jgi:hypothetical protein